MQQPSVAGLAGPSPDEQGSASLQEQVLKKMIFVQQTFQDIANIVPEASGLMDKLINTMRSGMAPILMKGATPAPASQVPGSLLSGTAGTGMPLMTGQ